MLAPLTRAGARDAAAHELSKGIYQSQRPGLIQLLIKKLTSLLGQAVQKSADASPGGAWGLVVLVLLLVAAVVAIRLKSGPLARGARLPDRRGAVAAELSAEEHRQRAGRHAAGGRYADAVRERLRAIVADLERRAVLEPRLARTADEMADEAGAVLPDLATDLRRAARTFDDVWYGGRPATAAMDADLRQIDRRVQDARSQLTQCQLSQSQLTQSQLTHGEPAGPPTLPVLPR